MRPLFVSAIAATAMLLSASAYAVDRNVTFVNQTGRDIEFLGFNPPGDEVWNDNEIGDVLGNGDTEYVKFNQADRGCSWNIKITFADDKSSVRLNAIDLCTIA